MYHTKLLAQMQEQAPRMNMDLAKGLASKVVPGCVEYVDQVMRCAETIFPDGLTYDGYKYCCPREQFTDMTRVRHSKRRLEITHSDMFQIRLNFSLNGESLKPRYLMIPYVHRGGILTIRGSKFVVNPVLTDNLLTVEQDKIFMPFTRSKIKFEELNYYFIANGKDVPATVYYSKLHFTMNGQSPTSIFPTLVNYMLAYDGATTTFRGTFGVDAHIGTSETINEDNFPAKKWVICETKGLMNRGNRANFRPTELKVAVPVKDIERTEVVSLLGSFFYILDNYGGSFITEEYLDDPTVWRRALVRFTWRTFDEREKLDQIDKHLESVSHYLDELMLRKLRHEGIDITSMVELFKYVIVNFPQLRQGTDPADTHNKVLSVVPILMEGVVNMIFLLAFELQTYTGKRLNRMNIDSVFDRKFRADKVMSVNYDNDAVNGLESATDCMLFKATATLGSTARDGKSGKASEMSNPAYRLHPSQITTASYLMISKSCPSGRGRINPFLTLTPHGNVVPDPELKGHLENMTELLELKK